LRQKKVTIKNKYQSRKIVFTLISVTY